MATRNSLSVIESELSSALTEALVSTGLVEAEEERFDNAKYRPICTVTIIMCSQSQDCQLSRIYHESHGFSADLTLSRASSSNSRIYIYKEEHCTITLHVYSREEPVPSLAGRPAIRIFIALGGVHKGEKYALPTARAAKLITCAPPNIKTYGLRDYLVPSPTAGNESTSLVIRHSNAGKKGF